MMHIPTKICRAELPYMGGKRGIAYEIMLALAQRHPNARYFYDMFGGGGSMSMMAYQFGLHVHYNEFCPFPYTVVRYVWEHGFPPEWWMWVTREDFFDALKKDDPRSCMIRYVWSFGNSGTTYLFGKDREECKRLAHLIVVFRDSAALKDFNGYFGTHLGLPKGKTISSRLSDWQKQLRPILNGKTGKCTNVGRVSILQEILQLERVSRIQQMKQIDAVGRLARVERMSHVEHGAEMVFSCGSYDQVIIDTPPEETIVYCDPPYRGTAGYVSGKEGRGTFSTEYFDNWVRACQFPVYISEYSAPFELVFSLLKRETMAGARAGTANLKTEKLYWNGVTAGLAAYAMPSANGGPHA